MSIKVALLGIGKMGKNHLRVLSLLKNVEIKYIFDLDEAELIELSNKYDVAWTTNLEQALSEVDAVVIATPTSTHYDYFLKCAEAAKYIFIEKPIAASLEEAKSIEEIATERDIYVQCGFIERFNPVVSELRRVLENETVINADFTRTNKLSARITDVDVVLDLMIHDIDLAMYLNGPVENVVAYGKRENGLVAFASAIFQHQNGALSRVLSSRMTEKKIRSIQVTTDQAYIDAELVRKELLVHRQSTVIQEDGKPYKVSSLEEQLEVRQQEALLEQHQSFIEACQGNVSDVVPNLKAGVESIRISNKILEQIQRV